MAYSYPYHSTEATYIQKSTPGIDYHVWVATDFDLAGHVLRIDSPIIEIAGPTKDGYYFLEGINLPSEVVITNVSLHGGWPFHTDRDQEIAMVTRRVDATQMPYSDNSIGIVLCAGLTTIDHKQTSNEEDVRSIDIALDLETAQAAIGILPPNKVQYNQRVKAYLEVWRTLEPGGLFFMTGPLADIKILQRIGFELKAVLQQRIVGFLGPSTITYEFVVEK